VTRVHIPPPLRSYTSQQAIVTVNGSTVAELLVDLDRHYPGIRFRIIDEQDRIRRHIKIFVNADEAPDLAARASEKDEVTIICAISGG
jgi:molybdopterin converting factor small subunit